VSERERERERERKREVGGMGKWERGKKTNKERPVELIGGGSSAEKLLSNLKGTREITDYID
jgi:hypothetical protein